MKSTNKDRLISYLYILIMLVAIILSNKTRFVLGKRRTVNSKKTLTNISPERTRQVVYNVAKNWFFVLVIVGALGFIMLVGTIGIQGLVRMSGGARGVSGTLADSNARVGYGKLFAKFLIASMSPGLLLYQIRKSRLFQVLLYIIFGLSFLLEIFIAGKSNFILFLLPYFLYFFTGYSGRIKTKYLVLISGLMLIGVFFLDNWFYYLQNGVSVSVYRTSWTVHDYFIRYIKEFIYPYANLLCVSKMNHEFGYRLFIDIPAIIINFIPAVLLGGYQVPLLYKNVTDYYHLIGSKSVDGVPCDFLTYTLSQAGALSAFLIPFIRIQLFKYIDENILFVKGNLDRIGLNGNHFVTCCCALGFVTVLLEPHLALKNQPILVCSIIMGLQISKELKMCQ